MKAQATTANQTELKRREISGPYSVDPFARGPSITEEYYSTASGQMISDVKTATGDT